MLELSGLFLGFGGVNVIRDLSLRVARGERLVILGPNGAGKTSLLRLIAGEARPQQGNIWLHHRDITREGVPARARAGIGRGFQQTSLFTGMTLRENLSLASGGHAGVIEHHEFNRFIIGEPDGTRSERGPFSLPPLKLQERIRLTISRPDTMVTPKAT